MLDIGFLGLGPALFMGELLPLFIVLRRIALSIAAACMVILTAKRVSRSKHLNFRTKETGSPMEVES